MSGLSIWVIYGYPTDFPDKVVARCWIGQEPTGSIIIADTLDRVRQEMIEMGLVKLDRMPGDDPKIVETWL